MVLLITVQLVYAAADRVGRLSQTESSRQYKRHRATDGPDCCEPRMDTVLHLTRLGGPEFALNPDLIERAEATPDTVVTLINGSKYVIRESLARLAALILGYRADVVAAAHDLAESHSPNGRHHGGGDPAGNNVHRLRPNGNG